MCKKKTKRNTNPSLTKHLWKRILSNKQNISYDITSIGMFIPEKQELNRLLKDENKLTKRTTKRENFEKSLKMININVFNIFRYNWTASDNTIYSLFNYKLLNPIGILGLPKELKKTGENNNFKKKLSKRSVVPVLFKKWNFQKKIPFNFQFLYNSNGAVLFLTISPQAINEYEHIH